MNVKMLIAATLSSFLFGSFTYAATSPRLVDDMMSSSPGMSGASNGMNDNMGGISGTNDMSGSANMSGSMNMSGSTNMSGNAMSGANSMNNNGSDNSADTATGD